MLISSIYKINKLILIDASGIKPRFNLKNKLRILNYKIRKRLKLNVDNMGSEDYKNASSYLRNTFLNIVNTHLDNQLKNIKADTLILWGENDLTTPVYMAKKINKKIKNSTLILLKGDHFAYTQDKNFLKFLKDFLDGNNN